jgi:hypothetical protein
MFEKILKNEKNEKGKVTHIVHISDIHIMNTNDRKQEYQDVFNRLKQKLLEHSNLNFIIVITGDITDFKNNVTLSGVQQLIHFLKLISSISPTIIIPGNHDINTKNENDGSLLEELCNSINSDNDIYYLKKSGSYEYNNICFNVMNMNENDVPFFSPNISQNKTKVFLHHGFVYDDDKSCNMSYMLQHKHINLSELLHNDICLIGDIHKRTQFKKILGGYAGSLLQTSHKEKANNHGFTLYDIKNKTSKFCEIENKYMFHTVKLYGESKGIFNNIEIKNKILRLKIKYQNVCEKSIQQIIDEYAKHNIIEKIEKEEIFENNVSNFMAPKCKENNEKNSLVIKSLEYENVFCYQNNNKVSFDKDYVIEKKSMMNIILFMLFDRILSGNVKPQDMINVYASEYKITINIEVDGVSHKIIKTGNINNRREIMLYKFKNGDYENLTKSNVQENVDNVSQILKIEYEKFIALFCDNNFIHKENADKKNILFNVFGITVVNKIPTIVNNDLIINNNKLFYLYVQKQKILNLLKQKITTRITKSKYLEIRLTMINKKIRFLFKKIEKLENDRKNEYFDLIGSNGVQFDYLQKKCKILENETNNILQHDGHKIKIKIEHTKIGKRGVINVHKTENEKNININLISKKESQLIGTSIRKGLQNMINTKCNVNFSLL